MLAEGTSVRDAAKLLNCHHATLYRAINATGGRTDNLELLR
ncbi:helix-turn-helix domain-containing protein [Klebsiella quasipneumoniae]